MLALMAVLASAVLALPVAAARVPVRKAELERRLAGPDGTVMVVAHRACWKGTSENSLDAIRACIAAGIDMVELDVRATRDGKLVLMHDATVDRMTEGTGNVSDLDWADLRKLHLREGKGRRGDEPAPLTARRIPTFEEALRAAKDRILINIDAKVPLSPAILAMIDAAGGRAQVLFKAEAPLEQVRELAPWLQDVHFMPILREPYIKADPAMAVAAYDPVRPVGYEIDVKDRAFAPVMTPLIHARCARYWVDSLAGRAFSDTDAVHDPDAVWGRLVALGVDAIQTDAPVRLKAYLRRTDRRALSCPGG
ncbi:glycerophosphodiester phosphodiesterase family protein [Novosphingobium beihaiensis]|uniref:Glycerophosphodiester phosphodiesterase family protein n=1 Tax=Novosphingobium beihaiensis TaxID=2930389 RepID=A0ABT0BL44_9SPHN|nr:glycerophosphodiester phosphodiesterase family protein [Novosphingobium beihaiensis]MCJ2185785.1 glycerophosphodiester phosphodiesterase family protein [Novosphingobium beihaiensis]